METAAIPAHARAERTSLLLDSTPLLKDPEALRERAGVEGYLFFRRLLPLDDVWALRREMLTVIDRFGWREAGQDSLGGRLDLNRINQTPTEEMRTDIGVTTTMYEAAQKMEALHRFPHHPALLALFHQIFGTEVFVHPRHIARMVSPHPSMVPTPPHQDFPLIQGTDETWTAWIPLGDCLRSMGGLSVLRGSHHNGYVPIQPSKGAGGIAVELCPSETDWVAGDYQAGDVLTFPSFTIHKALRCSAKEQVRLSMDVRYQPSHLPIEAKSLQPHCNLKWEDIYADWKLDDLKYYWSNQSLNLIPWNDDHIQPARRIC